MTMLRIETKFPKYHLTVTDSEIAAELAKRSQTGHVLSLTHPLSLQKRKKKVVTVYVN